MKLENRLFLSKMLIIGGFVALVAGSVMIFNYLNDSGTMFHFSILPQAYAQNVTQINGTINSLDGFFNQGKVLSVFYLVFFLIALFVFMLASILLRKSQYAAVFSISALILSIIVSFFFLTPIDFVYVQEDTKITAEQIGWPDGNYTMNTSVIKNHNVSVLVPYDSQLRLIISALFLILAIFNGLYAILIITKQSTI